MYWVELGPLASVCVDTMSSLTCLRFLFAITQDVGVSRCVVATVCVSGTVCLQVD